MVFHSVFRWPSLKWFFVPRNPAKSKASLGEARKAVAAACTSNSLLRSKASAALRGKSWAVVPAKTKPFRNELEMSKEWNVDVLSCLLPKTKHPIYDKSTAYQGHLQKSFQKEGLHTASKFRNCSLSHQPEGRATDLTRWQGPGCWFWSKKHRDFPFFSSLWKNDCSGTLNLWMLSKWQH